MSNEETSRQCMEIEDCTVNPSQWVCPVCQKQLSRKQTLKAHLLSLHSIIAGNPAKRYKQYEYDSDEEIPRSTKSRWNKKEKSMEEQSSSFKNSESPGCSTHQNESSNESMLENPSHFSSTLEDPSAGCSTSQANSADILIHQYEFQIGSVSCIGEENTGFSNQNNLATSSSSDSFPGPLDSTVGNLIAEGDNLEIEDMECSEDSLESESSMYESDVSTDENLDSEQNISPPLFVLPASTALHMSSISHQQHMLLVCAYATTQKVSGVAFQQLLDIISLHLPEKNICEENVLQLKEKLANEEVIFYEICRKCGSLYEENVIICRTPGCGTRKVSDSADKKRMCFATGNCQKQLANILETQGNMAKIEQEIAKRTTDTDNTDICDVTSGQFYKQLCKPGQFLDKTSESCNITLTWNTDGIPLFKSSAVSLWPVYLAINELPPKERFLKKNLIVWGIWQGEGKPSMNTFLSQFVKDMLKLYHTGFPVNGKMCRVQLLLGSMDLQARAYAMNSVQHNGTSSCLYCKETGKVVKSGKGHCRCFPYNADVQLRTKLSIMEAAESAGTCGKAVDGFYGKSVLLCLPFFQPEQHIVIDYMHGVLLGINKKLFTLWFDGKYHKKDFFIGHRIEDIDIMLKKIKPPYLICRLPRKLKNNSHRWKASEIRSWFLFYSIPCLSGILPKLYLEHFACLVEGIHLLLLECISSQNLTRANALIHAFYRNSTELYGDNFAGLNVHNLLHYADFVKMWGPLWAWSCFGFESCNGEILQSIHGKGNVCSEIFWSLHAEKQIDLHVRMMPKSKVKSCLEKMLYRSRRRLPNTKQGYQCEFLPPLQDFMVPDELLQDLNIARADSISPVDDNHDASFAKVLKVVRHGFVFYSKCCTRVKKRNSYTALLEVQASDGGKVIAIDYFVVNKNTTRVFAVGHTMRVIGPVLHQLGSHVLKVQIIRRSVTAVPAQNLKEPVVFMERGNEQFIACFPNFVEMD